MKVVFRPRAEHDLDALYEYIHAQSLNLDIAFNYVWRLRAACLSLSQFPERGAPRNDILNGLRILVFESRTVIAYRVTDVVEILAVSHGGQDWQKALKTGHS